MKRKLTNLIERVGLAKCRMHICPSCHEIGLEVCCPDSGDVFHVHTTDFKKVCTVRALAKVA